MLTKFRKRVYVESTSQGILTHAFPLKVSTIRQMGYSKRDTVLSEGVGERWPLYKVDEVDRQSRWIGIDGVPLEFDDLALRQSLSSDISREVDGLRSDFCFKMENIP
jgi:hypothetical protein